ncbi:hypothetical protein HGRIS_000599 [Hohenbuehelia grisea]|uniref:Uncharacterized protein n=1 Tax=Hohenbuehelia grisea TaxID=104357 RepID=A0ABR3JTJ8_9AGAR
MSISRGGYVDWQSEPIIHGYPVFATSRPVSIVQIPIFSEKIQHHNAPALALAQMPS